jgi:hypothetical protein
MAKRATRAGKSRKIFAPRPMSQEQKHDSSFTVPQTLIANINESSFPDGLALILKEKLLIGGTVRYEEEMFRVGTSQQYTQSKILKMVGRVKGSRKTLNLVVSRAVDEYLSNLELVYHEDNQVLCYFALEGIPHYLLVWDNGDRAAPTFQVINAKNHLVLSSKSDVERFIPRFSPQSVLFCQLRKPIKVLEIPEDLP